MKGGPLRTGSRAESDGDQTAISADQTAISADAEIVALSARSITAYAYCNLHDLWASEPFEVPAAG
jgi:desulfoferrodoxin (superoxide reductase-like protein)